MHPRALVLRERLTPGFICTNRQAIFSRHSESHVGSAIPLLTYIHDIDMIYAAQTLQKYQKHIHMFCGVSIQVANTENLTPPSEPQTS